MYVGALLRGSGRRGGRGDSHRKNLSCNNRLLNFIFFGGTNLIFRDSQKKSLAHSIRSPLREQNSQADIKPGTKKVCFF